MFRVFVDLQLMEKKLVFMGVIVSVIALVFSETDPNDLEILKKLKNGLDNPELLEWPENEDPCGKPGWKHVFCEDARVSQIQVRGLGLIGHLPQNFNSLTMLSNLGLQQNNFTGQIPSFSGLSKLRYAYLDFNTFDSIPPDFFAGLNNLEVMALDFNDLNSTDGWPFPDDLRDSLMLRNLSLINCNLVGPIPEFIGKMSSLSDLRLSMNRISGEIPLTFADSILQILWLNDQHSGGMTGSIHVISSMTSLTSLWLHGNSFTGSIPDNIGNLTSLKDFNLNGNNLVGFIPDSLAKMELEKLDLNNNHLMGSIPKFKARYVTLASNSFCEYIPGIPCDSQVTALLDFIRDLNYPLRLVSAWTGNHPCLDPWLGLGCTRQKVSIINLPKFGLVGTLSPSLANLDSLMEIRLVSNNITGPIPTNWEGLKSLRLLDLSHNDLSPPLPKFGNTVKIVINDNPQLLSNGNSNSNSNNSNNISQTPPSPRNAPFPEAPQSQSKNPYLPASNSSITPNEKNDETRSKTGIIVIAVSTSIVAFTMLIFVILFYLKSKKIDNRTSSTLVLHPRGPSENEVKIAVASNTYSPMKSCPASRSNSTRDESHVIEAGNLLISVQVLRNVTKNFSPKNELGRGGFGVVYKGELNDGTEIAVKRMEAGVIGKNGLDEFQAEIAVLSKVRHRHLVSLLGYSVEGSERLLVYEYMPLGALSKHLFHWKTLGLEPLSWNKRLNIALDVARGMEYLHGLAHQSFVHRDLKPSNILIGHDYRAKISDFGLVKLTSDGATSFSTKLAGTFGYLAPEYAVTGKITTKADVFSFGVVLLELITGLMALDVGRPEETQYLASWFWNIKWNKEKLMAAVDRNLELKPETLDGILVISELAGHCMAREPGQRPDMGHAVNMLAPLVDNWRPFDNKADEYSGIDYSLPLNQLVKGWREAEGKSLSYLIEEDSKESIPTRPAGLAESFSSLDGR